jgi:hypothetical protein
MNTGVTSSFPARNHLENRLIASTSERGTSAQIHQWTLRAHGRFRNVWQPTLNNRVLKFDAEEPMSVYFAVSG